MVVTHCDPDSSATHVERDSHAADQAEIRRVHAPLAVVAIRALGESRSLSFQSTAHLEPERRTGVDEGFWADCGGGELEPHQRRNLEVGHRQAAGEAWNGGVF